MNMNPHRACLSAVVLVAMLLTPIHAYAAAPPRVVILADLAAKPLEVAISSKQLTLIHFETGDVSMVAVGDPAIVSVTVKGPDVLLKALTSSGSTNAFIWQGGRYTQWTFTVRQNSKDARLIIVKDLITTARDESGKNAEGTGKDRKTATGLIATAAPSGQPPIGTSTANSATLSAPANQLSAESAQQQPVTARTSAPDPCGASTTLDHFVKTLSASQRELFSAFLTTPTLERLRALLLELSVTQRCDLLALLSAPASSEQPTTVSPISTAPASAPSAVNGDERNQTQTTTVESCCGSAARDGGFPVAAQPGRPVTAGVVFSVTPQVIDGQLFLYYVLENHSEATLLTDTLRLRIFDGSGNRLTFGVNRASRDGYLGRLETKGVEYGVIAVDAPEKILVLEWKLIRFGSGAQQLVRAEVQVP